MMRLIIIILFIVSSEGYCQTSERPRYAPRSEKHTNKTDELGHRQGHWKFFAESGTITWELDYLDDIKHGLSRRYYSGGRIMRESEYEYGIREGLYKRYYLSGQLRQEGNYSSNKRSGKWTAWFSSGNIQSEGMYVDGFKEGEWNYYNQKGQLINTILFIKGRDRNELVAAEKKAAAEKLKKQKANRSLHIKTLPPPLSKDSLRL